MCSVGTPLFIRLSLDFSFLFRGAVGRGVGLWSWDLCDAGVRGEASGPLARSFSHRRGSSCSQLSSSTHVQWSQLRDRVRSAWVWLTFDREGSGQGFGFAFEIPGWTFEQSRSSTVVLSGNRSASCCGLGTLAPPFLQESSYASLRSAFPSFTLVLVMWLCLMSFCYFVVWLIVWSLPEETMCQSCPLTSAHVSFARSWDAVWYPRAFPFCRIHSPLFSLHLIWCLVWMWFDCYFVFSFHCVVLLVSVSWECFAASSYAMSARILAQSFQLAIAQVLCAIGGLVIVVWYPCSYLFCRIHSLTIPPFTFTFSVYKSVSIVSFFGPSLCSVVVCVSFFVVVFCSYALWLLLSPD